MERAGRILTTRIARVRDGKVVQRKTPRVIARDIISAEEEVRKSCVLPFKPINKNLNEFSQNTSPTIDSESFPDTRMFLIKTKSIIPKNQSRLRLEVEEIHRNHRPQCRWFETIPNFQN